MEEGKEDEIRLQTDRGTDDDRNDCYAVSVVSINAEIMPYLVVFNDL